MSAENNLGKGRTVNRMGTATDLRIGQLVGKELRAVSDGTYIGRVTGINDYGNLIMINGKARYAIGYEGVKSGQYDLVEETGGEKK